MRSDYVHCSFEDLSLFLKEPATIATAEEFLCAINEGQQIPVRRFLASFPIVLFKSKVFQHIGDKETALFESAVRLLERFENGATRDFCSVLAEYLKMFAAWKEADSTRVTTMIKNALIALYQAQSSMDHADMALVARFTEQVERLRERFRIVAGIAALAAFEAEHGAAARVSAMGDERLVHALLFNPDFEIGDDLCFAWGPLRGMLSPSGLDDSAVLTSICNGIAEMKPREARFIMAAHGQFGWDVVETVVEVIRRTQSPRRDADFVAAYVPTESLRNVLELLAKQVNLMRVDEMNGMIRRLSPAVCANGFDMERRKFQARLDNGTASLDITTAWIGEVVAANRDLVPSLAVLKLAPVFKRVYLKAVVSLVVNASSPCPETLAMDVDRIEELREAFRGVSVEALEAAVCSTGGAADNIKLLVSVNWSVHAQTYTRVIGLQAESLMN